MSDKLTALDPGSVEFLRVLLSIAEASDHVMDRAMVKGLRRMIELKEEEVISDEKAR